MSNLGLVETSKITALKSKITELKELYQSTEEMSAAIGSACRSGGMAEAEKITELISTMEKILNVQASVTKEYCEIDSKSFPDTLDGMLEKLEKLSRLNSEFGVYISAINFFMSLRSQDASLNAYLDMHKQQLETYDLTQITAEDCKFELNKYVSLQELYQASDRLKKFEMAIKLASSFPSQLLFAVQEGEIQPSADFAEETQGCTSEVSDEEAATQDKAASNEAFPVDTSSKESRADDGKVSGENYAAPAKAAEAPQDIGDTAAESSMTGTDSAGSDISDNEENTSAESTSTADDVADETAAAEDACEKADKAPAGESENKADEAESVTWDSLGIANPEDVCISIDNKKFRIEFPSKNKPFGVKDFKSDIKKLGINSVKVLRLAQFNCAATAQYFAALSDIPSKDTSGSSLRIFEAVCEKLFQLGYFNRYIIDGAETLYILSAKGQKIFANQNAARFIDYKEFREGVGESIKDTANAAFARIVMCRMLSVFSKILPELDVEHHILRVSTDALSATFYKLFGREGVSAAYYGIFSDSPKCFGELFHMIEEEHSEVSAFIIAGLNKQHAKAVADLIYGKFAKETEGKKLLYLDVETETHYDYFSDTAVLQLTEADFPAAAAAATDGESSPKAENDTTNAAEADAVPDTNNAAPVTEEIPEEQPEVSQNEADAESQDVAAHIPDEDAEEKPALEEKPEQDAAADNTPDAPSDSQEHSDKAPAPFAQLPDAADVSDADQDLYDREKAAAKSLTEDKSRRYDDTVTKMIIAGEFECACAYLNVLSRKHPDYQIKYRQLAYALDDPLEGCEYNSDRIFDIYFHSVSITNEYYAVAAAIRNFATDYRTYDYSLQSLRDSVSGLSPMENNSALAKVIYTLQSFKSKYNYGIDYYADYRQNKSEHIEAELSAIREAARDICENYINTNVRENASNPRAYETKKLIFAPSTDLAVTVEAVKNDDRSMLPIIEDYLRSNFIKDDAEISVKNISLSKIADFIDANWNKAGELLGLRISIAFIGRLRSSLLSHIKKAITVLCEYVSVLQFVPVTQDDAGALEYKSIKKSLLSDISGAMAHFGESKPKTLEEEAGKTVLIYALGQLKAKLDGELENDGNRYFYISFLKNSKVLLDDDYLPVLDDVSEIESMSILSRIESHFNEPKTELEMRIDDIGDDYGSAALILRYLREHPGLVSNTAIFEADINENISHCRNGMENRRKNFIGYLELAQSYGQITDGDKKEAWGQVMDTWYERTMESNNFGFFYKILDAIEQKIMEDATVRKEVLTAHLDHYLSQNPELTLEQMAVVKDIRSKIEAQYYAAAEDKLNRLSDGDTEANVSVMPDDYLKQFLDEFDFNWRQTGNAGATSSLNRLRENLLLTHNSKTQAGAKLIKAWPIGNNAPVSKIKDLLNLLQFPNAPEAEVTLSSTYKIKGKYDDYYVRLKRPATGKMNNYQHPISAFGSEAEERGFRIVTIYANMNSDTLIEIIKEIGDTLPTIILLDAALNLPERRELARRVKLECNSTPFLVVDRVALVFLARHYDDFSQEINRVLMAITVPFAAYQPYVVESSKVMPPEMFMGRSAELNTIESPRGVSLVYGGRQLGKSALLRMAQKRRNRNERGDRAILVDIKNKDYAQAALKISAELSDQGILKEELITDSWDDIERAVKKRLADTSDPIPYLLLLIDEADTFIESAAQIRYAPIDNLKRIQESGKFKFVIAGLHNIIRFNMKSIDQNGDVIKFDSCIIKPFKALEARELLETPLFYLGFRFPNDSHTEMLISTIFGTTNYFPGLIQLYCKKLIESLQQHDYAGYDGTNTPPYIIKEEHIRNILADKTLDEQIREKFSITLKLDGDDYYYLIALLAAFHYHNDANGQTGCSADDILKTASDFGIKKIAALSHNIVNAYMEEMKDLNVLRYAGNGRYRFARHSFCQMMGSPQDIDDEILDYATKEEG